MSANTSLMSEYRENVAGDTSDTDYESAAEATDHDLSFDGRTWSLSLISS